MPYKSMDDQVEANRRYRERKRTRVKISKNHLAFLELEIQRLNSCLEVALSK